MTASTKLVDIDGYVFVRNSDASYDAPVVIHRSFPTGLKTAQILDHYGERAFTSELRWDRLSGMYVIPRGGGVNVDIAVRTIGDATITEESVPPPKVRKGTEILWSYGHWEKYSKSKGWVLA